MAAARKIALRDIFVFIPFNSLTARRYPAAGQGLMISEQALISRLLQCGMGLLHFQDGSIFKEEQTAGVRYMDQIPYL